MANLNIDLSDLTNSALKRLVTQLLAAKDGQEQKILNALKGKKNDLADLHEEQHGKPNTPMVEADDDPFELDAQGDGEDSDGGDSESDMMPKKGKK